MRVASTLGAAHGDAGSAGGECSSSSIRALVRTDIGWIPPGEDGALYLRPFMFASEVFLGVKPAARYLYIVMASSVGSYFKGARRASRSG